MTRRVVLTDAGSTVVAVPADPLQELHHFLDIHAPDACLLLEYADADWELVDPEHGEYRLREGAVPYVPVERRGALEALLVAYGFEVRRVPGLAEALDG